MIDTAMLAAAQLTQSAELRCRVPLEYFPVPPRWLPVSNVGDQGRLRYKESTYSYEVVAEKGDHRTVVLDDGTELHQTRDCWGDWVTDESRAAGKSTSLDARLRDPVARQSFIESVAETVRKRLPSTRETTTFSVDLMPAAQGQVEFRVWKKTGGKKVQTLDLGPVRKQLMAALNVADMTAERAVRDVAGLIASFLKALKSG